MTWNRERHYLGGKWKEKRKSQIRYLSPVRSRAEVLNFCAPWDIWQCLKSFWVVTTEGRGATSISWAEARDAVKPTMYRTAPHNKESSGAKCQQYWGWHWSRVVWTFWNSRTCSWRSPDFIVGLAKMKRMPTDQNPALQLLHLSCGTLASNFSSESMRGPWMKPGSGESPGEEAPGSEQWRQSLGKASLWFRKLYRQREERLP